MTKIKLSLPSGSEVEKTVLSYFNNNGNYIIFDAENVGSMGLPIILVSKVTNDKVEKINDQNEWQLVKGYLKSIISGEKVNYINAPGTMSADEVYYTQLTLPVASFDALKNAYANSSIPNDNLASDNTAELTANEPVVADVAAPVVSDAVVGNPNDQGTAIANETPAIDVNVNNSGMEPVNMSTSQEPSLSVDSSIPVENAPVNEEPAIANPIIGEAPIANEGLNSSVDIPANNNIPVDAPIPVVSEVQENVVQDPIEQAPVVETNPINPVESQVVAQPTSGFDETKQRFMNACEEIYDIIKSLK